MEEIAPAGPKPALSPHPLPPGRSLPDPGDERLRSLITTSAGSASPQRLAVYPRAERTQCAPGFRNIEKVQIDFFRFLQFFISVLRQASPLE